MEALLGTATHHSSPDRRAQRGADAQRAVYARALYTLGGADAQRAACPATQI